MSSLYPMNTSNNTNYGLDDTNLNYSSRQPLSDNNVHVNNSSSLIDYYGQEHFHPTTTSRHIPIYNNQLYPDNSNQFYRYNIIPSNQPK